MIKMRYIDFYLLALLLSIVKNEKCFFFQSVLMLFHVFGITFYVCDVFRLEKDFLTMKTDLIGQLDHEKAASAELIGQLEQERAESVKLSVRLQEQEKVWTERQQEHSRVNTLMSLTHANILLYHLWRHTGHSLTSLTSVPSVIFAV